MEKNQEKNLIEICRSFSYKLSLPSYQSRDFFCSQKCECEEKDAELKSEQLYEFCKNEVMKSVRKYIEETKEEKELNFQDTKL